MAYAPGVQFDPSLITGTGDRLAAGITAIGNEYKQKRKEAKAADALYAALQVDSGADGAVPAHPIMPKDKWDSLSWGDKTAAMGGFVKAKVLQGTLQEQELARKRMAIEEAYAKQRQAAGDREATAEGALGKVFADAGTRTATTPGTGISDDASPEDVNANLTGAGGGQPGVTPQALMEALTRNPQAVNARGAGNINNIIRSLQASEAGGNPSYDEDPITGVRNYRFGKIVMPSGVNPTRAGQAVAITGPSGEDLGAGLPSRSGVTPLKTGKVTDSKRYDALNGKLKALIKSQGAAAYNQTAFDAYQEHIDALLPQIQALEGGAVTTPSESPKPASILDWVKQKVSAAGYKLEDLMPPPANAKAAPASMAVTLPTATNPKTGARMVYKDGKWQPLK